MEEQNQSLIKINASLLAALSKGGLHLDVFSKDIADAGRSFSLTKSYSLVLTRPSNAFFSVSKQIGSNL